MSRPTYGRPGPDEDPGRHEYGYGQVPYGGSGGYGSAGSGGSAGQPVCPRHPDRVSYVKCQRCGRPTCPECQRPSSVGVLCSDCDAQAERAQRASRARTMAGGAMGSSTPFVTYAVIGICVVLFLLQQIAPSAVEQPLIYAPFRTLAMPWTLLTGAFLHASLMHIAFNMYAMWVTGNYLERALGHWRFAAIFIISALAGNVLVFLLASPDASSWVTGTVGASGGIFGLFGALFVASRRSGAPTGQIVMLIGINLVITFLYPNISWQGHLGGLVMGTGLTAALFALRPKAYQGADREALGRRAAMIHGGLFLGALVLLIVLVGIKVAMVPAAVLPMM